MVLGLDDCLYKDWNGRVCRNKANLLAEDQNNTTSKSKGIWVFAIVWMVLTVFSEDLPKASRDKTENNNLQMKHMIDSFEALKKKNAKKVNK